MREDHDPCSPSQLERRHLCPGSLALEKKVMDVEHFQERSTFDQDRGIMLHSMVPEHFKNKSFEADNKDVTSCVDLLDKIIATFDRSDKYVVLFEELLDLTKLGIKTTDHSPRLDCAIILMTKRYSTAFLFDWKFGMSHVSSPEYNLQLKAYSWGLMEKYGCDVIAYKHQPGVEYGLVTESHVFDIEDFDNIKNEIKGIIEVANSENPPCVVGKKQCQYCKATDICPARRGALLRIPSHVPIDMHIKSLTAKERAVLYEDIKIAKQWCEKGMEAIKNNIISGSMEMDGYDVVNGNASYVWKDTAEFFLREHAIKMGINPEDLFEPQQLKSYSKLKQIFGSAVDSKATLEESVTKVYKTKTIKKVGQNDNGD